MRFLEFSCDTKTGLLIRLSLSTNMMVISRWISKVHFPRDTEKPVLDEKTNRLRAPERSKRCGSTLITEAGYRIMQIYTFLQALHIRLKIYN